MKGSAPKGIRGVLPLEAAPPLGEVGLLKQAQALGVRVAPTWVVALEEEFYRLNNLEDQLQSLFRGVFGVRVDEERLLWAVAEAEKRVRASYLLPERAEAFLLALRGQGPFLLRRMGEAPKAQARTPQEALFALKRAWAEGFGLEAILARYPRLLPEPIPFLVQEGAGEVVEDPFLSLDLGQALGQPLRAYTLGGALVYLEAYGG